MALLVLLLGTWSLLMQARINQQSQDLHDNWVPSIVLLGDLQQSTLKVQALTLRVLAERDPQKTAQTIRQAEELVNKIKSAEGNYERLISSPEERDVYGRLRASERAYLEERSQVLEPAQ